MSARPLATPASNTRPDERRRTARLPHVAEAWIASPTAIDEKLEVSTVNVSRHGVCFELAEPVAPGTFHIIELSMGGQTIHSEVRIISCRQDAGRYEIGAEFC